MKIKRRVFAKTRKKGNSNEKTFAGACERAKCDTLVGARYTVEYKWYYLWNEASVTVTGYPAKLTGVEFRPAEFKK